MGEILRDSAHLREADLRSCDLSGATVLASDLRGVTIRECFVDGLRIVGSVLGEVHVSSFGGDPARVVVEDVDVWDFVSATLDARHPERVQLRDVATADDHRAMWSTVERLWAQLYADAEDLPDAVRRTRVAGEWSLLETVRHLVFAIDGWLGRMLTGLPMTGPDAAYHPIGLPPTDFPDEHLAAVGLDPAADPTWEEAADLLRRRQSDVRDALDRLTDEELTETRTIAIAPPVWNEESETVATCFRVLSREHVEHLRYARRDLATLAEATGE